MLSSRSDLSQIGFGVGWKILLVEQLLLLVVEQLPNLILFTIRASKISLVEAEVTCMLFQKDFSNFLSNNFRNTTSWKCFLKNDCIRSSLIECQSFLKSKIHVDPKKPRLAVTSMHCAGIVQDVIHSNR